jgi:simple sugar transport system substrate-binding protein
MEALNMRRLGVLATAIAVSALMASGAIAQTEVKKIAVLTPEQGTDYGWNQQGTDAAKAAAENLGLEIEVAGGLGYGDVRPIMRELAADGVDLLIAHASGYNTAGPEIAAESGVAVAVVDNPGAMKEGLVADYTVSGHEGAYLAGVLAAKMSRSGTLGIVVSGEPPSWNAQSAGFAQGAKAANPDIKLVYAVIGPAAYGDAAGGKRVTESVIAAGADIIFGQGNGSSFGMIQAVETSKATDGGKVWFIDVIGDKRELDKGHLLSSVLWNLTPTYTQIINDLKEGAFGTHSYAIGLKDGSVDLLETGHADAGAWAEAMAAKDKILSGEIAVEQVYDAEKVRAMMSELDINE